MRYSEGGLLVDRPTVVITEEGSTIQVELPNLTILIKQKV